MNKCCMYVLAAFTTLSAMYPAVSRADTLTIGYLSYDVTDASGAINNFDLYNFTGVNAQSSTDVIADGNELFSGTLTLNTSAGTVTQTFSAVDLNGYTFPTLAAATDIYSAVLSLTLSNSSGVGIYDSGGNAAVADLQAVADLTLSPLSPATSLLACDGSGSPCAAGAITVDTVPVSSTVTPEPETIWLVMSGVGGMAAFARRIRRR